MKISEAILVAVFLIFIYAGGYWHGTAKAADELTNTTQDQLIDLLLKQQAWIKENIKGT
jgi:hypothetical protein